MSGSCERWPLEINVGCSFVKCPRFPKDFIMQCETNYVFVDVESHHILNDHDSNKLIIVKTDPVDQHQNHLGMESNDNDGDKSGSDFV